MSQRNRLFILLFAVTIPMFGLAAAFVLTSVDGARASADREAIHSARSGALATESFVEGYRRSLVALAPSFRGAPTLSEPDLRARLAEVTGTDDEWDGMSVVGADSIALAGSRPTSAGVDLSAREYLQEMFATGRTVISDGVRTVEGTPSVLIATPVDFADGTGGALIGALALDSLGELLMQTLSSNTQVDLVDATGHSLVSPTETPEQPLDPVGHLEGVRAALAGDSGTMQVERDGEDSLVAYASVGELGWGVTVTEAEGSAYAEATTLGRRGAILVSLAALGVVAGGWYLGGRLNRSYVAIQDAREAEAEARERAEAALRSREEFISIASHELRNPVAVVRGVGQLMQRRLERGDLTEERLHEYVGSVATSGLYLSRLVEDLLNVSRLEGGRLDLKLSDSLLHDVVARAQQEAPMGDHTVVVALPAEPIAVRWDVDRVTQILVNLLENAAKYSPPRSDVHLAAEVDAEAVRLSVSDAGIGLPPEEVERLFSPFGRASNARDANIPGLGLGLYVSRRIAEALGGGLDARSDGAGEGATFTLTLPRSDAGASEEAQLSPHVEGAREFRVPDPLDGRDAIPIDRSTADAPGRTGR